MGIRSIPILRWFLVPYAPDPTARTFLDRAQTETQGGVKVSVAALDVREARRFFGVNMAHRGMQPVWLRVENQGKTPYRVNLLSIDPSYFPPYEAAAINHFRTGRHLLEVGLVIWLIFLPLLFWLFVTLPIKMFFVRRANRAMDAYFQEHAFHLRPIDPGAATEGFVFTSLDAGNKIVHVTLLGHDDTKMYVFTAPVPGLNADYLHRDFQDRFKPDELVACDVGELRAQIEKMAPATSNKHGTRSGDPVNLVIVGEFPTVLSALGARWDETETITLSTCWKTARAYLLGSEYRYSPVSGLYLFGRVQDFALQRVRQSINERLHLRLWGTPLRFQGQPVWVGQISRDIGVRFTWRTWNLTTHRIDPDVDEARDYVVQDLLQAERLEIAGYVDGVGPCTQAAPRHNLTGDPYFTDGKRAAVLVSPIHTAPKFIAWS